VSRAGAGDAPRGVPAIWGSVPQRNKNFTGREALLEDLGRRVAGDVTAVLPHALQGLGGVGKTQVAVEYAYRHVHDYDVVWWVPADQEILVRSSLAALAPRLGLTGIAPERVEDSVRAVLDSLRRGDPYSRWLLIFDNADQPETIRDLMPNGPGHVLVTSRNHRWQSIADTVEVNVFARAESLEFLHRRVPSSVDDDSDRLAEELGDLPLALEQAGALQAETGMSVKEYLDLLNKEARKLLAENRPSDYPWPVAAAWSLSVARLRDQMPFALELLRRCAFFGPEPIARDLLQRGRYVLGPPLKDALGDPIIVSRAMRELGRYALAKIDNYRKTIQVHRLIQKLLRDELAEDDVATVRHEVHLLLAAADPGDPGLEENWPKYDALLAHVGPSAIVACRDADARRLVRYVIDYLYNIGDYTACLAEIDQARKAQDTESHVDDLEVLILLGQRSRVLWALGRHREAAKIRQDLLGRALNALGPDDEYTLHTTNGYGADLRVDGKFKDALKLDEELLEKHRRILGPDPNTFMVAHNLAIDCCLDGDYRRARTVDEQNHQERLDFYGRDDHLLVLTSLGAIARDLRLDGEYAAAAKTGERARQIFEDIVQQRVVPQNHPYILLQAKDYSIALRKVGAFQEALALADQVHRNYLQRFDADHPETLGAAINLSNAQRAAGDIGAATGRIEETVRGYAEVWGGDHPFSHGCVMNLAIVRRLLGNLDVARALLEQALAGLRRSVGPAHHYTLSCATNLATVLADLGDVETARALGEDTLRTFRTALGEDHPHTLACAANLALDLRALGQHDEADELGKDALARNLRTLGEDHPGVQESMRGERLTIDFEPPEV
jgi:tetratricopeptide (TPR) repeat protein